MYTHASEQYKMLAPGVTICFSHVALISGQPSSPHLHETVQRNTELCVPELQEARGGDNATGRYGYNSQDVLIPAFLDAYRGK